MTRVVILAALLLTGCASPVAAERWALSGCQGDGVQSADGPAPTACPTVPRERRGRP